MLLKCNKNDRYAHVGIIVSLYKAQFLHQKSMAANISNLPRMGVDI